MKRAFTMVELVFTIVILSIVAMVATDMIAKTYVSYNQVESQHKANLKVEIALNSIANRLSYAIGGTVVKRKSRTDTAIAPIDQAPSDYEVLEWIGYDIDGFVAQEAPLQVGFAPAPAWSGFCNILSSSKNSILTPGSDLGLESNIVANLSRGDIATADSLKNTALFFLGNYNYTNVGYWYNGSHNTSGIAIVDSADMPNPDTPTFNLQDNPSLPSNTGIDRVTEHYKLAWSAYAVVPVNFRDDPTGGEQLFDLKLVYDFRPWEKDDNDYNKKVTDDIATHGRPAHESLLVTNVTVFKTYATENRIHIKLCVKERFNVSKKTSICKERVVSR